MPRDPFAPIDPFDTDDVLSMTHQPEAPNPVPPIVEAGKAFATQGLQGLANQQGVNTPAWSKALGKVLSSEAANTAIGMASPIKGPTSTFEKALTAFHGSPHDFEKFDLSKIGTGEGAQAYGHGLYFAENEGVARAYKNDPKMMSFAKGKDWTNAEEEAFNWLHENEYDQKAASEAVAKRISQARMYGDSPESTASLNEVKNLIDSGWQAPRGHMYQVSINADPEHFLDWDKPLSEQHPKVQQALRSALDNPNAVRPKANKILSDILEEDKAWTDPNAGDRYGRWNGQKIIQRLESEGYGEKGAASEALRQAGIPGIKYLDQGSRASGEGTRNFVVFDDKLIDIIKKYGWAGLGLPAIGAAGGDDGK